MNQTTENIDTLKAGYFSIYTPPPKLTLSEWADEYAYLSPESAAEPGKWTTMPTQKGVMDAMTDPRVEQITWMKSARTGYTKCINNLIGYHIHQDPCPIIVAQPTLDDAQGYSKDEIAPMIRDTPVLDGLVSDPRSRDSNNTVLKKSYPGGVLTMIGANSARGFRRITARIAIGDEIDGYPPTAGQEGDQIQLLIRRTMTFWNRKIILGSTPTIKGMSRIESNFEQSDKRYYHVPCPHCSYMQVLKWANLKWEPKQPNTAHFICVECGAVIEEKHKARMVTQGEWIGSEPFSGHAGFHIWAAYSLFPNAAWSKLVAEFLQVKDDPSTLQTFINTVLGETWEDAGERIDDIELLNRAEKYSTATCPAGVLCLTMGVDVQKDRLEYEIVGWGEKEESWSLDYEKIPGDPSRQEVWDRLDEVLDRQFRRPGGGVFKVNCCCIDTGYADVVNSVYKYVVTRQARRVHAVKGHSQMNKPIVSRPTKVGVGRQVRLYMVGTDTAKGTIFARLRIDKPGPGFCHFPDHYNQEYYDGLTAEEAKTKKVNGVAVGYVYRKIRPRNEPLDCRVYALAALYILNPHFKKIARKAQKAQEAKPKEPEVQPLKKRMSRRKKGGYVKGWR